MKLILNPFIKKLLSRIFFILGRICPNIRILKCCNSIQECHTYFSNLGYPFRVYSPIILNEQQESDVLISLVIPIYNAEKYLERLLKSIVSQTYNGKYEVVLINDGSVDDSQAIIDEYVGRYPNVFRAFAQSNHGISSARNRGIRESQGKYIGFIDNDDYLLPTYLEKIAKKISESDYDMIQTGVREEKDDGTLISETQKVDAQYKTIDLDSLPNLSGYVWDGVYKKSMFNQVDFPDGFWYEDMITVLLLFRIVKSTAVISEILYVKTDHQKNAAKTLWNNRNLKSVDQYWLARQLVDYGKSHFGLPDDDLLVYNLLYEYGPQLYRRTFGLDYKTRSAIFESAAFHFNTIQKSTTISDAFRKEIYMALKERNNIKWRFICLAWILSIH